LNSIEQKRRAKEESREFALLARKDLEALQRVLEKLR
jgi:hypothetical protein